MCTLFMLFVLCNILNVYGYRLNKMKNVLNRNVCLKAVGAANSYQQLREQAAKLKSGQANVNTITPQSIKPATFVTEDDEDDSDNGLPFSDRVYDHFKYVIAKITNRVKSGIPLSKDEIDKFEKSINAIILDAKTKAALPVSKAQPSKSTTTAMSSPITKTSIKQSQSSPVKKSNGSEEFSALQGLSSTWEVEGMDNMTTAEYYAALNKRNMAINAERKKKMGPGYDRNPGDDYIASISGERK